jgi:hypothetical protein
LEKDLNLKLPDLAIGTYLMLSYPMSSSRQVVNEDDEKREETKNPLRQYHHP